MDEFYFHCPHCAEEIKAYTDMIGKIGECPGCGSDITIPYPNRKRNPEKSQPENRKLTICKTCGKQISVNAAACPECGEPNPEAQSNTQKSRMSYIALALLFGGIGVNDIYAGFYKMAKIKFAFCSIPAAILIIVDLIAYAMHDPGDLYNFKPFEPPAAPAIIWGVFLISCCITSLFAFYQIFATDTDANGNKMK
jgi:predicted RNA-binding Zn-ribbon protein involved in translation (DUF1610 family)